MLEFFPALQAQASALAEHARAGAPAHVANGIARAHLLSGVADRLGPDTVFARVPTQLDRSIYTILSIAAQCGEESSCQVAEVLRRHPTRIEEALEALTSAVGARILIADDVDRLEGSADELSEVLGSDAAAVRGWLQNHARVWGTTTFSAGAVAPDIGQPQPSAMRTWEQVEQDAVRFQLAVTRTKILTGDFAGWTTGDILSDVWTGLGAELREPVAFLLVHDRPIERALFLAATEARPTALDAAIEMGLVRALRGWLWVPDEWRSLSPRIEQRDRLRRRLAEGLERVALSDPAPEAVLEAHRHLAALGESRRAARFAEFGVLLLLDLARGQSIGRHYPSAARTYEAVLEFDERIRAAADPEGVGPHPRAYAIHYRAYNRYKAGSHGSVLETLAAYREALGLWPEHALFWSRTISCCFVAGRYEEALRARAQAFASVPPHPNRSTLLIQRTVEHLLERGLVLPALLVWDNHRPETIPQRHVGERLFETAAAGWQCEEIWAPTTGSLRFAPAVEVHVRRDGDRFQCMLFDLEPPDAPRPSEAVANAIRAVRDTAIAALEQERDVAWLAVLDSERPAGSDEDAAWLAALLRLRARRLDWRMPEVQHRAVLEILRRMREAAPSIRRPLLGPTEEGAYQLVWSYRDRSAALEIEVGVDGSVQWLFIDRDKGSCEGSDEPEPHLPERAVSFAQRIA